MSFAYINIVQAGHEDFSAAGNRGAPGECRLENILVGAGSTIFEQGDPSEHTYRILSGSVDIVVVGKDGTEKRIASLGPDEDFGEMGIIDPAPLSATAIAREPTACQVYDAETVIEVMSSNPAQAMDFAKTLILRLRASNRWPPRRTCPPQTSGIRLNIIAADAQFPKSRETRECWLPLLFRITKRGDGTARALLYEAANSILTRFKGSMKLKSSAFRIAERSGLKKARVALARRLAVIKHAMMMDGTEFAMS